MTASGTYNLGLSNGSVVTEAFDRIGVRPAMIDRHMLQSAGNSLNLELISWENQGFNFWKITSGTVALAAGTATYTLPATLVTIEEVYYTAVNANGSGVNADRTMIPLTRGEYAAITNKLQPGPPTQYWFQMTIPPQITFWQVPATGQVSPNFLVSWYGLQQMQDANLGSGETPDVPRRALDALASRLAVRLAEKFGPKDQSRVAFMLEKKTLADEAWNAFARRDQEPGSTLYRPNVSHYARIG